MSSQENPITVEFDTYTIDVFMLFTLVADALAKEGKYDEAVTFLDEASSQFSFEDVKQVARKYVTLKEVE